MQRLRFANVRGRASIVVSDTTAVDLEDASHGRFSSDPMAGYERWDELRTFAESLTGGDSFALADLGAPAPRPRQVFGIGLNYREHAMETGAALPEVPLTFTKYVSSINAPYGDIPIGVSSADWEVEMVLIVGRGGRNIPIDAGWKSIAAICVGQDVSDRVLQRATQPPQFGLGKSREGYAPFGPWAVDASSIERRDSLAISCRLNGEIVQHSTTADLIFGVPRLVAYLSEIVQLLPGDLIFTGTPSGVGSARTPARYLAPGDVIESTLEAVGSIVNRCVTPLPAATR